MIFLSKEAIILTKQVNMPVGYTPDSCGFVQWLVSVNLLLVQTTRSRFQILPLRQTTKKRLHRGGVFRPHLNYSISLACLFDRTNGHWVLIILHQIAISISFFFFSLNTSRPQVQKRHAYSDQQARRTCANLEISVILFQIIILLVSLSDLFTKQQNFEYLIRILLLKIQSKRSHT